MFEIIYDHEVAQHLRAIEPKYYSLIRQTIKQQLEHEPITETRNRKPLTDATEFGANTWEIRFGPNNQFRVFYRVDSEANQVRILAIGIKIRKKLFIQGEEFEL